MAGALPQRVVIKSVMSLSQSIEPCTGYTPVHVSFVESRISLVLNEKILLSKVEMRVDDSIVAMERFEFRDLTGVALTKVSDKSLVSLYIDVLMLRYVYADLSAIESLASTLGEFLSVQGK